jgi:ABC-2 type transport system ATP-binding protein
VSAPAIETSGLAHRFRDRVALRGLDLAVPAASVTALLGPNGSGKSTLFRILATLLRPAAGTARVEGRDVVREAGAVRRSLGVAFQSASLDDRLGVRENLVHQGHLYGLRGRPLGARIAEALERAGLAGRADDRVGTLSGGLRRRVDLARALLHRPRVLLLDEPSAGLDPAARRDLLGALARYRDEDSGTCFLTTHLLEEAAWCDRVAILDAGRLVAEGPPTELVREVGGDVVELRTDEAADLARDVAERFGRAAQASDGAVRLETEGGAELLPELLAAFPGRIRAATVSRPDLADVFFRRAGHRFPGEER